jgi:hypothetical protein
MLMIPKKDILFIMKQRKFVDCDFCVMIFATFSQIANGRKHFLCFVGFMKILGLHECTCQDDDYRPLSGYRKGYDDG